MIEIVMVEKAQNHNVIFRIVFFQAIVLPMCLFVMEIMRCVTHQLACVIVKLDMK